MTTSKDLFLAILAMDAYNRGYGEGIDGLGGPGTSIGKTRIVQESSTIDNSDAVDAGFYALKYETDDYGDVISYRGTDTSSFPVMLDDVVNGWFIGGGVPFNEQGYLAAEFFQAATGTTDGDPRTMVLSR